MKAMRVNPRTVSLWTISLSTLFLAVTAVTTPTASAAEKGGLLIEISKKTTARNDKVTVNGVGNMEIDKDQTLKIDIKNNSSKDLPETPVDTIVLINRYFTETANVERYTGTAKIPPLKPGQTTSIDAGSFHIGGHMHGSSDMHVDKVVAWKVSLTRDGQKLEFSSGSNFENLERRAKPGTGK
jgi:archaellum component FlaG (FlaF/FlaG flagellin family)